VTRPHETVRAIRASLDSGEIRACLDAAATARGASYSVLFPAAGSFELLLGGNGDGASGAHAGPGAAAGTEQLERLFAAAGDRLAPVPGPPGATPLLAASALRFRGEKYGLFLLRPGGDPDLAWWQEIVDALSSELVKVQLYEAANDESIASAAKLDALGEAGDLVKYVELRTLLTKLMELSIRITQADVGAIVLEEDGKLTTGIEWGLPEEILVSLKDGSGKPFVRSAIDAGRPVFIADAASSPHLDTSDLHVHVSSLALVPLVTQSKRLGAIVVVKAGDVALRREDAQVLETIGGLCGAAIENATLYETTRQHARITAEMNLAAQVQASLAPRELESWPGLEIAGWCVTASETGGDFYDYFDLGNGKTGIVVADATGHGMGAALLVSIARATLRALLTHTRSLGDVMRAMNDLLEADSDDGHFLTCFFGILDRGTGVLDYCSAGHDPPIVRRAATGTIEEPATGGIPLGMFRGTEFPVAQVRLDPGDFVVLGTDGIWEARSPAGEFFGRHRLIRVVEETHALPTPEASARIRRAILDFHEGGERLDDITAVVFRVGRA
jgi:phosphoserine phosphatase RsbU/P